MDVEQSGEFEFTHTLNLDDIEREGTTIEFEADADERARLARRFGLIDVDRLVARFRVTRGASGIPIRVTGRVEGCVTQRCVVSLEPISVEIGEDVDVEYAPRDEEDLAEEFSLEGPDIEPLGGSRIDLGELAAQNLAVALDPYPRKAKAQPPSWAKNLENKGESQSENPFSVLATLRKKSR